MRRRRNARLCIVCVFLSLFSGLLHAAMKVGFGKVCPSPFGGGPWSQFAAMARDACASVGDIGAAPLHTGPGGSAIRTAQHDGSPFVPFLPQMQRTGSPWQRERHSDPEGAPTVSEQAEVSNDAPYSAPYGPYPSAQRGGLPWQRGYYPAPPRNRTVLRILDVEAEVSEDEPYLQQSVIYTVRVISSRNLSRVDLKLPSLDGVAFEKLDGPKVRVQHNDKGQRRVVTEFQYALTPLRSGELWIPPIRVTGTLAPDPRFEGFQPSPFGQQAADSDEFDLTAAEGGLLRVRPAEAAIQPWLPLQSLEIEADVSTQRTHTAGEPITITVSLSAVGLSGDQLPSLTSWLESPDFKVYREKSQTMSELSQDGTQLLGRRTERYTLVPQRSGELHLASIRIPWWNVTTQQKEWAMWAGQAVLVTGASRRPSAAREAYTSRREALRASPLGYWGPVLTAFGLIIVYWLGVWGRRVGFWPQVKDRASGLKGRARGAWAAFLANSSRRLKAMRDRVPLIGYPFRQSKHRIVLAMPTSLKVWYCLRRIEFEQDPEEWSQLLQLVVGKHLNLPVHTPVATITEAMIECHPRPKTAALRALVHELEEALYGGKSLDFPTWKRSFRRQLRLWMLPRKRACSKRRAGDALPKLNPSIS